MSKKIRSLDSVPLVLHLSSLSSFANHHALMRRMILTSLWASVECVGNEMCGVGVMTVFCVDSVCGSAPW